MATSWPFSLQEQGQQQQQQQQQAAQRGQLPGTTADAVLYTAHHHHHHHHHQITKLSHSINAIGPAPHRSGYILLCQLLCR
jgi:hypothetical protein